MGPMNSTGYARAQAIHHRYKIAVEYLSMCAQNAGTEMAEQEIYDLANQAFAVAGITDPDAPEVPGHKKILLMVLQAVFAEAIYEALHHQKFSPRHSVLVAAEAALWVARSFASMPRY